MGSKKKDKKLAKNDLVQIIPHLIDYPKSVYGKVRKTINFAQRHGQGHGHVRNTLKTVFDSPENFLDDSLYCELAKEILNFPDVEPRQGLLESPKEFKIWGQENIEASAIEQMRQAMRLPHVQGGALMPDAHHGYSVPIGSVIATKGVILPYAVGVDIGCRMSLSVFDHKVSEFENRKDLINLVKYNTRFGPREVFEDPHSEHEIFSRQEFQDIQILKGLKDKAIRQIGTSGGGNHFCDLGIVEVLDMNNALGLDPGQYFALLTHSGSRGFGAQISNHYTKIAQQQCQHLGEMAKLGWLDLDSEAGQEYYLAMQLAGDYAKACHDDIHRRFSVHFGQPIASVENHHNYAWEEEHFGENVIVHRKGATPAHTGRLGFIPGSMTLPGYVVEGKGTQESLSSASHGAGRKMSRRQAKKLFSEKEVKKELKIAGVDVIGSGLDEAPGSYKNIDEVMASQNDLVKVVAKFLPKIVRMEG